MTIKAKRWTFIGIISTLLASVVGLTAYSLAKPKKEFGFIVSSSASISSVNYVKETSGQQVYSSVVEGLIAPSPIGVEQDKSDSLSTIIDTPKLEILGSLYGSKNTFDGFQETPSSIYKLTDVKQFTFGLADSISFSSENENVQTLGKIWKFHIRNAKWANGDRVSANDFVQTLKYAINLKNSSTLIRTFRDAVPLKGVAELIDEQQKYYEQYGKFRDRLSDYVNYSKVFSQNGGVWAQSDPKDDSSSFYSYPGSTHKSSSYLYYQLKAGSESSSFYGLLGNSLFLPTNKRFIDGIGGFDKFGTSGSTILSNGAFVIDKYDPDYQVSMKKSSTYWDKEHVISNSWAYRIIPDISSTIQLFREGKLAQVQVPPVYLKTFKESPELSQFLTHGGTASSTNYIKWNLSRRGSHTAVHPNIVSSPYIRRAISAAINRKEIIETKGLGAATPSGDVFASPLSRFSDENNNKLEDYLYRQNYQNPMTGTDAGSMLQFNPKISSKFHQHETIDGINKDSYHNQDEARANIEAFIKENPEYRNKKIPLNLLFDTSDQYTALIIKQELNDVLGDKIELIIKPVPTSVYELKLSNNEGFDFAIAYQSPDYQTDSWTFLRMLAQKPNPSVELTSTINATGEWFFLEGYEWLEKHDPSRLSMFNKWDGENGTYQEFKKELEEISTSPNFSTYGSYLTSVKGWSTSKKMNFYTHLEMLIRDQAPVIPLWHAASMWFARRIIGATAIAGFPIQYKYAYNANNVPDSKFSLPGIEAISHTD